jgi:hypothetical protein
MRAIILTGLVLSCLAAGCESSGPTVFRRTGAVTFDGKAVPLGKVYFEPDVAAGGSGSTGFADIRDGKYDTGTTKGSPSGPTIVRVVGYSDQNKDATSGFGPPLFVEYVTKADLPAEKSEFNVEVPASAAKGLPKKTAPLDP